MSKHRFSTGLTYTLSRKVFHDGCAKRVIFSHQILNKNRLCLAHCALNRSFTVFMNRPVQIFMPVKDKIGSDNQMSQVDSMETPTKCNIIK